ncbi:MAG: bifunctional UDP-N-acetylglucosamine diphosphorylase/glucosamine-1-phosphate N-acetyltransferase GlmU [Chlorobia bacterium]|nr:bifunctional UDP-N-acetylglucosamine diphosphorylase/glucosamine-1-phosphate N-acetyltransferase GlmU [Fimbriimonadaceae bacterium]
MSNLPVAGIILAAGKGTRMKSDQPKGLHEVCGLPMVDHVARALRGAGVERIVIVVGHGGESIQKRLGEGYAYAWQNEQKGTGHAAQMAAHLLAGFQGKIVVTAGDTPLVSSDMFAALISGGSLHTKCLIASSFVDNPKGYGRIVRSGVGVQRIVEEKDASPDEQEIQEVNSSIYCFDGPTLLECLPNLTNDNAQGEFYLTDVIAMVAEGGGADAMVFDDPDILVGVNDRWQLAEADRKMGERILRRHAESGVTIMDPGTTYLGAEVEIGVDTVLEPSTMIVGKTQIGKSCRIGPFTRIENCKIGNDVMIYVSYLKEAVLHDTAKVGPYAHIRPGSELYPDVKVGNFVETKNAILETGVKASHLTYIGDAIIGENTNIGAGTITCNYDGFHKSRTEIGRDVFVGSNSTLVAPIKLGDGSFVAAGSVVTGGEYPAGALVIGRSRTEVKEQWAAQWRNKKTKKDQ